MVAVEIRKIIGKFILNLFEENFERKSNKIIYKIQHGLNSTIQQTDKNQHLKDRIKVDPKKFPHRISWNIAQ